MPTPEPKDDSNNVVEIEYEDEPIDYADAISWTTRYNEEIARRQAEDPSYTFSFSGSGTETDPYLIQNEYDFYQIRTKTNGCYFKLTNDIYLNKGKFYENKDSGNIEYHSRKDENDNLYIWPKISKISNCTIDGCNHAIYGLYGIGFTFGYWSVTISNSKICNLHFKNSFSTPIENKTSAYYAATHGIIATGVDNSRFENVTTDGWVDGMFGSNPMVYKGNNSIFNDCVNFAKVLLKNDSYPTGGICGEGVNCWFDHCKNYASDDKLSSGIVGKSDSSTVKDCVNFGNIENNYSGGIVCNAVGNSKILNCNNYGDAICAIARNLQDSGQIYSCFNYGKITYSLLLSLGVNCSIICSENRSNFNSYAGVVNNCYGTIYKCGNYSNSVYGITEVLYQNAKIVDCESIGNFTYYVGKILNNGASIKNCMIRGSVSNLKGIANTNKATIDGLIFIGTINGEQRKLYHGTDFSAFFLNQKKGFIGLKSLHDAGVYMFTIPNEAYLLGHGFTKVA